MRSIPAAMTWEMFTRGYWGILAATFGAIAFPAFIFMALESDGALNPQDVSMLMMHIVFMHINVLMIAGAIITAQGQTRLLYAYPLRTSSMVAWRMLPGMTVAFAQTAVSIAVLNALFDLDWPVWGPAFFVAVAVASVQAVLWLTDKSLLWTIVALTFVAALLGMWFKTRYGAASGMPTHHWHQLTPGEVATMLAITGISFCVAVAGVARNRRGDPPMSLGVLEWLNRHFDVPASRAKWGNSPTRAQFWFEWRRKGWIMPFTALVLLVLGLIFWLVFSRDTGELMLGIVNGSMLLWLLSILCGLMLGNVGPNENEFQMGQFLATRPLTDIQMARVTLGTAAASLFLAWLIWAIAIAVASTILLAVGDSQAEALPSGFRWWHIPGMLLGPWLVAGTMMSLTMTGSKRMNQAATGLLMTVLLLPLVAKITLGTEAQWMFNRLLFALLAATIVLGTAWVFASARRRALVQAPTLWAAAGLWAAGFLLAMWQWPVQFEPRWFGYLLASSAFALAVAPLAAAPLAVAANRHR